MRIIYLLLVMVCLVSAAAYCETAVDCYSEAGTFIGRTYLDLNKETIYVYDERGYYIGYIVLSDLPYLYYNKEGVRKAEVYINSAKAKAVFSFIEEK